MEINGNVLGGIINVLHGYGDINQQSRGINSSFVPTICHDCCPIPDRIQYPNRGSPK